MEPEAEEVPGVKEGVWGSALSSTETALERSILTVGRFVISLKQIRCAPCALIGRLRQLCCQWSKRRTTMSDSARKHSTSFETGLTLQSPPSWVSVPSSQGSA